MIEILEEWSIVDRWWSVTPTRKEFVEVLWDNRKLVFVREPPDKVWRIWKSEVGNDRTMAND
jgi:hypothetical protein